MITSRTADKHRNRALESASRVSGQAVSGAASARSDCRTAGPESRAAGVIRHRGQAKKTGVDRPFFSPRVSGRRGRPRQRIDLRVACAGSCDSRGQLSRRVHQCVSARDTSSASLAYRAAEPAFIRLRQRGNARAAARTGLPDRNAASRSLAFEQVGSVTRQSARCRAPRAPATRRAGGELAEHRVPRLAQQGFARASPISCRIIASLSASAMRSSRVRCCARSHSGQTRPQRGVFSFHCHSSNLFHSRRRTASMRRKMEPRALPPAGQSGRAHIRSRRQYLHASRTSARFSSASTKCGLRKWPSPLL